MQIFDGYYVTPCGRIWSYKRNKWLKPSLKQDGYLKVKLNNTFIAVQRVIALCWLPNPHHLPQVNHKDENKLNNNINNLEWCTISYNQRYSNGIEILNIKTGEVFNSIAEAAEKYNIDKHNLARGTTNNKIYKNAFKRKEIINYGTQY